MKKIQNITEYIKTISVALIAMVFAIGLPVTTLAYDDYSYGGNDYSYSNNDYSYGGNDYSYSDYDYSYSGNDYSYGGNDYSYSNNDYSYSDNDYSYSNQDYSYNTGNDYSYSSGDYSYDYSPTYAVNSGSYVGGTTYYTGTTYYPTYGSSYVYSGGYMGSNSTYTLPSTYYYYPSSVYSGSYTGSNSYYYPTTYYTPTYYTQPVANQVLSYTDTNPIVDSVYLSDIPATGFDDYYGILIFISILISWSAILSYIFLKKKMSENKLVEVSVENSDTNIKEESNHTDFMNQISSDNSDINKVEDYARENKILLSRDASTKIVKLSRLGKINASEYIKSIATGDWTAVGENQIQ
jgi:hypothetical protein